MTAYHATRDPDAVRREGVVRAMRMKDVYLFTELPAARHYAATFGYAEVVAVTVPKGSILARWRPSYCVVGRVLRVGMPCPVVPLEPT